MPSLGRGARQAPCACAAKFATGGLTVVAMLEALRPRYAWARQVDPDDACIRQEYVDYESPSGSGTMRGYMARPASSGAKAAILVIHENRGLNPYIEDVVRRFAAADFLAFGPDALTPLGGYPGNDDDGREMQSRLERDTVIEDFRAAAEFLMGHSGSTGRVGAVGFCFGGGVVDTLATRLADLGAGMPFYGSQPPAEAAPRIQAPLMIQYTGLHERINQGWPAFDAVLSANGNTYSMHMYGGVNRGFHNDTTPRCDEDAASLAQARTIASFDSYLR